MLFGLTPCFIVFIYFRTYLEYQLYMTSSSDFRIAADPEKSPIKRKHNLSDFDDVISNVLQKSRDSTFIKLKLLGKEREERASQKIYDDDFTRIVSEEFSDRLGVFFVIGD